MKKLLVLTAVACFACKGNQEPKTNTGSATPSETQTERAEPAPPVSADAALAAPEDAAALPSEPGAACKLITKDEAEKLIGAPVKSVSGSDTDCRYGGERHTQNINVRVFANSAADYEANRKVDIEGPGDKELKLGGGAKAYRRESGLIFGLLKSGTYVSVVMSVEPGAPRPGPELVEAQIKAIVSRL